MKMRSICAGVATIAVIFVGSAAGPTPSGATSLAARDASPGKGSGASPKVAHLTKDEIVAKYVNSCLGSTCEGRRVREGPEGCG